VDLGFAEGTTDAEGGTAAVLGNTNGHQNRAISETAIDTHFFKPGIKDEVRMGPRGRLRQELKWGSSSAVARLILPL
jgi:hypothetical protein